MDVVPRVFGHRAFQAPIAVAQVHSGAHIPASTPSHGRDKA